MRSGPRSGPRDLARRAAAVWRREGLRGLTRRARERWAGWQPEGELPLELDRPLPAALAVGKGNLLFLSGRCQLPRGARLEAVANGRACRATAVGGAFTALLPFRPDEAGLGVELALRARLRDGTLRTKTLGTVQLTGPIEEAASAEPAPRVAICMATYNPPPALFRRQIQSIRDQTFSDWVCLISDDGSEPDVLQLIREAAAADPRFRVLPGAARAGFYGNFERCLTAVPAGVEFVALSDHDDTWHPDKLEALLATFQRDTTLVYSDMAIVDGQGRPLADTYWTTRPNRCDDIGSLLIANTVTGAASMFRRSLLQHVLPFPQAVAAPFHDHWIACVALATGTIRYLDRPLYDYVQHSGNVLGHYAPQNATAWAEARGFVERTSRDPGRLRQTVGGWRAVYLGEVQRVKLAARLLQARCGTLMTPGKSAAVQRLARLDESWATALWLARRGLRHPRRVSETLGGERTLLRGLAWRLYEGVASRVRPRSDGAAPPLGPSPRRRSEALDRVGQIERKIAPLRLHVTQAAAARVNLLIPTIDFTYFFGGYITKFNLARKLAEQGRRVRIVAVDPCPDRMALWREQVRAFEGLEGFFDNVEVALAGDRERALEVSPADAFIATTWWTAHIAHQAVRSLGRERFLYLVQEYEPFTFPMGSLAALARESYTFPHRALFSTELLRDYFRREAIGVFAAGRVAGDAASMSFQNAITPVGAVSADQLANRWPRRLLFYARPEAHAARNMFELGVLALSRALAAGAFAGGWEFNGLGAVSETGGLPLGRGAHLRVLPRTTQQDYRGLLRGHDLGLSLMDTPHPSLVPIEMASAGMVVVTTTFANKTAAALAAISPNIRGVEPTIDAVSRGLQEAAAALADYRRRAEGAHVAWSTSWDTSFAANVLQGIAGLLAACET